MKVVLKYQKSTKGTHVYHNEEIPLTIYFPKAYVNDKDGKAPLTVQIEITNPTEEQSS